MDKEKRREYERKYWKEHREKAREKSNRWILKNSDKVKAYAIKWAIENPDKVKARDRKYSAKHRDQKRCDYLFRNYKITIDDYNNLLDSQNGKCAICGDKQSKNKRNYCVDHNHITGKVRGLLCDRCNWAIGLLDEDYERIIKCISYLFTDIVDEHG